MSLQLKRNDQQTVINITDQFLNFYYTQLNSKDFSQILPHLRDYTIYSSQKVRYRGQDILNYFNHLKTINANFDKIDYDTLHSGAKRINVLVTGEINYLNNGLTTKSHFSEFIHFGSDSDGNMWIQTSMFKIL